MSTSGSVAATFDLGNLNRAWRWISNNPDRLYKDICRPSYADYSTCITNVLSDVRDRGLRGLYEPSLARKIQLPKAKELSRTYSVLTLEDQLVYQAMVNVVAERFAPRVKRSSLVLSFGHIYAGKTSKTFYRDWRKCRREYINSAKRAFLRGLTHTAVFDLTNCYDTVSHTVIDHLFQNMGFDRDFRDLFRELLRRWTPAADGGIFLDAGIPQGPLGSGLVAELVLGNFDLQFDQNITVRKYMRYVDDIRVFGRSPDDLNRCIWALESTAKSLGLHPQSSKVDVHEVTDIYAELKSVSVPAEDLGSGRRFDQDKVRRRLIQLTPRFEVKDETRFKFVLSSATPEARLTQRLLRVLERRQSLFLPILGYMGKYQRFPGKCAETVLRLIADNRLRPFVRASLIDVSRNRLSPSQEGALNRSAKVLVKEGQPVDVRTACAKRVIKNGLAGPRLSRQLVTNDHWWVRAELTRSLNNQGLSLRQLAALLSHLICDPNSEVATAAALQVTQFRLVPQIRHDYWNPIAAKILRRMPSRQRCGVHQALSKLIGRDIPRLNWRRSFGPDYRWMEEHAIECERLVSTNPTAFVNALDVLLDMLLSKLHGLDRTLGTYQLGNLGGILQSTKLRTSYPRTSAFVAAVHTERGRSRYSHPVNRSTGKKTGSVPEAFVAKVRKDLPKVLIELAVVM